MGDAGDEDDPRVVVDRVHDPVVAHADAVVGAAGERDGTGGPWIVRQRVDRGSDAPRERIVQMPVGARRVPPEADLVRRRRPCRYRRTSGQGTADSRSSRA